jgi:hypothetical protein
MKKYSNKNIKESQLPIQSPLKKSTLPPLLHLPPISSPVKKSTLPPISSPVKKSTLPPISSPVKKSTLPPISSPVKKSSTLPPLPPISSPVKKSSTLPPLLPPSKKSSTLPPLLPPSKNPLRSGLTKVKDTDLYILSNLSNEDLNNFCALDKYSLNLCNEEWKRRFILKYGVESIKYKPSNISWKDHYAFVHYLCISTSYSRRIIDKEGRMKIGTKENSNIYKITNPKMRDSTYIDKIIFYRKDTHIYNLKEKEAVKILPVIEDFFTNLDDGEAFEANDFIVFRVDAKKEEDKYLNWLKKLNYFDTKHNKVTYYIRDDEYIEENDIKLHFLDIESISGENVGQPGEEDEYSSDPENESEDENETESEDEND